MGRNPAAGFAADVETAAAERPSVLPRTARPMLNRLNAAAAVALNYRREHEKHANSCNLKKNPEFSGHNFSAIEIQETNENAPRKLRL